MKSCETTRLSSYLTLRFVCEDLWLILVHMVCGTPASLLRHPNTTI
jgi:hypothetical protein